VRRYDKDSLIYVSSDHLKQCVVVPSTGGIPGLQEGSGVVEGQSQEPCTLPHTDPVGILLYCPTSLLSRSSLPNGHRRAHKRCRSPGSRQMKLVSP